MLASVEVVKTADRKAARLKYREYRDAFKADHREQDRRIYETYRQLARGRRVLNVYDAMRMAGVDEQHRPKLAICRADYSECYLFYGWSGMDPEFIFSGENINWQPTTWTRKNVVLPPNTFPEETCKLKLRASLPIIPPHLRPPKAKLRNYYVLWEAEWEDATPVDPMLLRKIRGHIYAVVAQWDLTELEQQILGLVR